MTNYGNWFHRDLGALIRHGDLTMTDKVIWALLNNHASNKTGRCFVKQATLAEESGAGLRTVSRSIANLRELGLIETFGNGGKGQPLVFTVPTGIPEKVARLLANYATDGVAEAATNYATGGANYATDDANYATGDRKYATDGVPSKGTPEGTPEGVPEGVPASTVDPTAAWGPSSTDYDPGEEFESLPGDAFVDVLLWHLIEDSRDLVAISDPPSPTECAGCRCSLSKPEESRGLCGDCASEGGPVLSAATEDQKWRDYLDGKAVPF